MHSYIKYINSFVVEAKNMRPKSHHERLICHGVEKILPKTYIRIHARMPEWTNSIFLKKSSKMIQKSLIKDFLFAMQLSVRVESIRLDHVKATQKIAISDKPTRSSFECFLIAYSNQNLIQLSFFVAKQLQLLLKS